MAHLGQEIINPRTGQRMKFIELVPALLALASRFGEEIRPVSPPWPVVRALAVILGPIARGRYPFGGDERTSRVAARAATTNGS